MTFFHSFLLSTLAGLLAAAPGARVHEQIELPAPEPENGEQKPKETKEVTFRAVVLRPTVVETIEVEQDGPDPEPADADNAPEETTRVDTPPVGEAAPAPDQALGRLVFGWASPGIQSTMNADHVRRSVQGLQALEELQVFAGHGLEEKMIGKVNFSGDEGGCLGFQFFPDGLGGLE